ncbi:MAG: archaeosortase/exosortase family protein, partial [Verrucomicrobiota bacterium]
MSDPASSPTLKTHTGFPLWAGALLALAAYLGIDWLRPLISMPLRLVSTSIAASLLEWFGYTITQEGTVLATEKLRFDVVPACSGSTILQVTLTLNAIWCAIHPSLSIGRRLFCLAMTPVFAILANGIRITAMVAYSHASGDIITGIAHQLVGLSAFSLAFLATLSLTQRLSRPLPEIRVSERSLKIILIVLAILQAIPVLFWLAKAWIDAPLEAHGPLILALAILTIALLWLRVPGHPMKLVLAIPLLFFAFLALVSLPLLDVHLFKAGALLLLFFALGATLKGWRFACAILPVLALIFLAFPSTRFHLFNQLNLPLTGSSIGWIFTLLLAGVLIWLPFPILRRANPTSIESASAFRGALLAGIVTLGLALTSQAVLASFALPSPEARPLIIPRSTDEWEDREIELPNEVTRLLGQDKV